VINAVIMVLIEILAIMSAIQLFFKYLTPREKKDLKLQRDKLFRDVEKLLKKGDKESILQVINTFEALEELSDKLGDFSLVNELRERSNNLRRQLGLEAKGDLGISAQEINKFIQQLMRGPYGKGTIIELALPEGQSPQMEESAKPKSLLEEGAEILARLRSIRGEDVEEKPTVLFPPAQPGISEAPAMETSSLGEEPSVINLPPPIMPPRASQSPPMAPSPSAAPPMAPLPFTPPPVPPMAQPAAPPRTPFAPPRPIAVPIHSPAILPAAAPPSKAPSKAPLPFTAPPPGPPRPIAVPIQPRVESSSSGANAISLPETPLPRETDEPQVIQVSEIVSDVSEPKPGVPSLKDEKSEILARLNQELPYLPENEKGSILEELMKRPAGKLRETWFKIIVHKNKQYAVQQ
jgi:hypothetical protein